MHRFEDVFVFFRIRFILIKSYC